VNVSFQTDLSILATADMRRQAGIQACVVPDNREHVWQHSVCSEAFSNKAGANPGGLQNTSEALKSRPVLPSIRSAKGRIQRDAGSCNEPDASLAKSRLQHPYPATIQVFEI
jgi:hypothetical protein